MYKTEDKNDCARDIQYRNIRDEDIQESYGQNAKLSSETCNSTDHSSSLRVVYLLAV